MVPKILVCERSRGRPEQQHRKQRGHCHYSNSRRPQPAGGEWGCRQLMGDAKLWAALKCFADDERDSCYMTCEWKPPVESKPWPASTGSTPSLEFCNPAAPALPQKVWSGRRHRIYPHCRSRGAGQKEGFRSKQSAWTKRRHDKVLHPQGQHNLKRCIS